MGDVSIYRNIFAEWFQILIDRGEGSEKKCFLRLDARLTSTQCFKLFHKQRTIGTMNHNEKQCWFTSTGTSEQWPNTWQACWAFWNEQNVDGEILPLTSVTYEVWRDFIDVSVEFSRHLKTLECIAWGSACHLESFYLIRAWHTTAQAFDTVHHGTLKGSNFSFWFHWNRSKSSFTRKVATCTSWISRRLVQHSHLSLH